MKREAESFSSLNTGQGDIDTASEPGSPGRVSACIEAAAQYLGELVRSNRLLYTADRHRSGVQTAEISAPPQTSGAGSVFVALQGSHLMSEAAGAVVAQHRHKRPANCNVRALFSAIGFCMVSSL